jgi:hypothetical protein
MKNKLASMFCFGTLVGSMASRNLDKTFAITWILLGLYTIVESYSRNNSNHLAIFLKTYGLFTK